MDASITQIKKQHTMSLLILFTILIASTCVYADDMRFEIGTGIGFAGGSAEHTGDPSWEVENAGTGLGFTGDLKLWKDNVWDSISLGGEYQYNYYSSSAELKEYDRFGQPSTSDSGNVRLDLHALFFNVVYRDEGEFYSPYIGIGLGVTYYDLYYATTERPRGDEDSVGHVCGFAPMAQLLGGLDISIDDSLYWGVEGKVGYFDASPVANADVSYYKMDMLLKVGFKF